MHGELEHRTPGAHERDVDLNLDLQVERATSRGQDIASSESYWYTRAPARFKSEPLNDRVKIPRISSSDHCDLFVASAPICETIRMVDR